MHDRIPSFPAYPKKAHASGAARIRVNGKDYYLGKFGSSESRKEYARLAQEFANGTKPTRKPSTSRPTVEDVVCLWLKNSPKQTPMELAHFKLTFIPLDRLYGATFADEFDAHKLGIVRDSMLSGSWMNDDERKTRTKNGRQLNWSKSYTIHQVKRVRRMFRWAETQGHVPRGTWDHLRALGPIGRHANARQTQKRKPVDYETQVKPCLPFMPPQVAAIAQTQYLIGARPSEVLHMKRSEVDITSVPGIWLFRPTNHKGEWRGDELIKPIGPQAQAIIAPWLMAAEPDGYVFPPLRNRYKRCHYDIEGYGRAIARACEAAGVKRWTAYQIRHAAGRRAEALAGLDGEAAHLGQRDIQTAKKYADRQNLEVAIEIARKIG